MRISHMITVLISAVAAASPPAKADSLRYVEGSPSAALASLNKEPNGAVALGDDGVLRSLAYDGTVIDYRQLDAAQHETFVRIFNNANISTTHENLDLDVISFADGRSVVDSEQLINPSPQILPEPFFNRVKVGFAEADVTVQGVVSTDDEDLDGYGDCSPPLYCEDGSTCTGGSCTVCTYIGFFPYGLCLNGGTGKTE